MGGSVPESSPAQLAVLQMHAESIRKARIQVLEPDGHGQNPASAAAFLVESCLSHFTAQCLSFPICELCIETLSSL